MKSIRCDAVLIALAVSVAACSGADGAGRGGANGDRPVVREIRLDGAPVERRSGMLPERPQPTVAEVLAKIDEARTDPRTAGVFLRLGPFGSAWARAADLAAGLQALRAAGKKLHCHFESADNVSYLLAATVCERISMSPAGMLDLVGVGLQAIYLRTLLENLGVRADLVQIGRFKGAADPFTRDDMPAEVRESLDALVADLSTALGKAVGLRPAIGVARAQSVIDGGPYGADGAQTAGLIDAVAFDDEARETLRQAAGAGRVVRVELVAKQQPLGLVDIVRVFSGERPEEEPKGSRLLVVHVEGTIGDGQDLEESGVQSGPYVRRLRSAADDPEIRGVVIRIDSPGGSALASDEIWHAVRRIAGRKPVVASIGDMAASGGYYIASAAPVLFADAESIVGSIGVVGGKVVLADLAQRAGVRSVILSRGAVATWTSPFAPFTELERARLTGLLEETYARFIDRVARGRSLAPDIVRASAEGRIMSGTRALTARLVDRVAGYEAALAEARQRAGLGANADVEHWPRARSVVDTIAEALGGGSEQDVRVRALRWAAAAAGLGRDAVALPEVLVREQVAVVLPFALELE